MILAILLTFFMLSPSVAGVNVANTETVTIIVVEGKAFLANVDEDGNIIHKYMEIEGELESGQDLQSQIEMAKQTYLALMEIEKDQIRFLAYDFLTDVVEPMAMMHLKDLSDHYNHSYANQIVITFGKRVGNEAFLKEKENLVVTALLNLNIPEEDIEVKYKWDRGHEPTEFIKINTGLRELPSI